MPRTLRVLVCAQNRATAIVSRITERPAGHSCLKEGLRRLRATMRFRPPPGRLPGDRAFGEYTEALERRARIPSKASRAVCTWPRRNGGQGAFADKEFVMKARASERLRLSIRDLPARWRKCGTLVGLHIETPALMADLPCWALFAGPRAWVSFRTELQFLIRKTRIPRAAKLVRHFMRGSWTRAQGRIRVALPHRSNRSDKGPALHESPNERAEPRASLAGDRRSAGQAPAFLRMQASGAESRPMAGPPRNGDVFPFIASLQRVSAYVPRRKPRLRAGAERILGPGHSRKAGRGRRHMLETPLLGFQPNGALNQDVDFLSVWAGNESLNSFSSSHADREKESRASAAYRHAQRLIPCGSVVTTQLIDAAARPI